MHNFARVVRHSLRYRWTIVTSLVCSFAVAILWGANLGAVYPLVEVVMDDKSLHHWIDERVATSAEKIATVEESIRNLGQSLATSRDAATPRRLNKAYAELKALRRSHARTTWFQPFIHDYAPDRPFPTLVLIVGMLFIGTLAKDLFLMGNMVLVERLAQLTTFDLRKLFYRRTLRMDLGAFGENRTSRYLSLFTHDMLAVSSGVNTLFGRAIREPLKMVACLVGAAFICWRLLLFSLVVSPLAIFFMRWLSRSVRRSNRRAMEEMSHLYGHLSESLTGIEAVKAFTMEQYERSRFHALAKRYMQRSMRIVSYASLTKPCTEMVGIGAISLALLAGGYLVLNDQTHLLGLKMSDDPLRLSELMAFFALLAGVSDPARKFSEIFNQLQRGVAASDRIYAMLDREPTVADPISPRALPRRPGEITFDRVNFHYQPNQPVLRDVSLRIEPGETLAIVGPNGCGKSTLTHLIPRFYDPVSGSVRIHDIDLRQLRLQDLRRQIGMVNQNTWLFDDTVLNNIRYGSLGATEMDVITAARQAYAHEFIEESLENGYQTVVGQGGQLLSGGQRQRIVLARAILRDPEILILDEATSQIDLESEQLIHQALVDFIGDRTAILITHRPSTLSLADRVLVMDSGRITDVGTHDQLMGRSPFYSRLYGLRESA